MVGWRQNCALVTIDGIHFEKEFHFCRNLKTEWRLVVVQVFIFMPIIGKEHLPRLTSVGDKWSCHMFKSLQYIE